MIFGLVFAAIGIGVSKAGAPIIFPIVFSGFGAIITVVFGWFLGASSRFTIDQHGLRGNSRIWLLSKTYDLTPPGFSACQARSNMSSGNTHYFSLTIEHAGQTVTVLRHCTDQGKLRRTVDTIRNLLEIDTTSEALVITTMNKHRSRRS